MNWLNGEEGRQILLKYACNGNESNLYLEKKMLKSAYFMYVDLYGG